LALTDWAKAIDTHLEMASLILLLVSSDFLGEESAEKKRKTILSGNATRMVSLWRNIDIAIERSVTFSGCS